VLYLPTSSPGLNPLERVGRQFRREVTQGELLVSVHALIEARLACCRRYNTHPQKVLSLIGATPHLPCGCT
jgi:hypothetical protein